jgi:shikimate dehydrogenase
MKKIFGIVGHPVTHSLSPAIHNAAIKHLKLDAEYRLFDIDPGDPENLANFCYETTLNNVYGFSVTMPYKLAIMAYMDEYDPLARIVGSVNTVVNDDNRLIGYNTDSMGCMQALKEKTDIIGQRALVMGAGGAGRAIAYGLKEFRADVFVFDRDPEKSEEMAKEFEIEAIGYRLIPEGQFDIIINATPVGTAPNAEESLLYSDQIPSHAVVMDVNTNPVETQLIKEAKKAGAQTVTGERMLLHQAVNQFKLFFNLEAPLEVMEKAMKEELRRRK